MTRHHEVRFARDPQEMNPSTRPHHLPPHPDLIITKIITTPFKNFFKNLNKDGDKAVDYIGRRGVMLSTISKEKMGNAEVVIEGNSYNVYVKSLDGSPIAYHQEVLIINKSKDNNYFLVQTYN